MRRPSHCRRAPETTSKAWGLRIWSTEPLVGLILSNAAGAVPMVVKFHQIAAVRLDLTLQVQGVDLPIIGRGIIETNQRNTGTGAGRDPITVAGVIVSSVIAVKIFCGSSARTPLQSRVGWFIGCAQGRIQFEKRNRWRRLSMELPDHTAIGIGRPRDIDRPYLPVICAVIGQSRDGSRGAVRPVPGSGANSSNQGSSVAVFVVNAVPVLAFRIRFRLKGC